MADNVMAMARKPTTIDAYLATVKGEKRAALDTCGSEIARICASDPPKSFPCAHRNASAPRARVLRVLRTALIRSEWHVSALLPPVRAVGLPSYQ